MQIPSTAAASRLMESTPMYGTRQFITVFTTVDSNPSELNQVHYITLLFL
jgi:hypothetical protein